MRGTGSRRSGYPGLAEPQHGCAACIGGQAGTSLRLKRVPCDCRMLSGAVSQFSSNLTGSSACALKRQNSAPARPPPVSEGGYSPMNSIGLTVCGPSGPLIRTCSHSPRNRPAQVIQILKTGFSGLRLYCIRQVRYALVDTQTRLGATHIRPHPARSHE